jgi:hypothetical protein
VRPRPPRPCRRPSQVAIDTQPPTQCPAPSTQTRTHRKRDTHTQTDRHTCMPLSPRIRTHMQRPKRSFSRLYSHLYARAETPRQKYTRTPPSLSSISSSCMEPAGVRRAGPQRAQRRWGVCSSGRRSGPAARPHHPPSPAARAAPIGWPTTPALPQSHTRATGARAQCIYHQAQPCMRA